VAVERGVLVGQGVFVTGTGVAFLGMGVSEAGGWVRVASTGNTERVGLMVGKGVGVTEVVEKNQTRPVIARIRVSRKPIPNKNRASAYTCLRRER